MIWYTISRCKQQSQATAAIITKRSAKAQGRKNDEDEGNREQGTERKAKPKMTAEKKACLAACKSFDADVELAKYISDIADCVLRDMCTTCDHFETCADDRKKIGCLSTLNCRMAAIASVTAGIIMKGGVK